MKPKHAAFLHSRLRGGLLYSIIIIIYFFHQGVHKLVSEQTGAIRSWRPLTASVFMLESHAA